MTDTANTGEASPAVRRRQPVWAAILVLISIGLVVLAWQVDYRFLVLLPFPLVGAYAAWSGVSKKEFFTAAGEGMGSGNSGPF